MLEERERERGGGGGEGREREREYLICSSADFHFNVSLQNLQKKNPGGVSLYHVHPLKDSGRGNVQVHLLIHQVNLLINATTRVIGQVHLLRKGRYCQKEDNVSSAPVMKCTLGMERQMYLLIFQVHLSFKLREYQMYLFYIKCTC